MVSFSLFFFFHCCSQHEHAAVQHGGREGVEEDQEGEEQEIQRYALVNSACTVLVQNSTYVTLSSWRELRGFGVDPAVCCVHAIAEKSRSKERARMGDASKF